MKIHEYQAKELLKSYGVKVPKGEVATSLEEVETIAAKYGKCVIKAQIHSGGRGKAGGVKLAENVEDAKAKAAKILHQRLITNQSGPEGKLVNKVLVGECCDIAKEFYLSITIDNAKENLVIIASAEGGTEIEEIAKDNPELIIKENYLLSAGLKAENIKNVAEAIKLDTKYYSQFEALLMAMHQLLIDKDASLVEINPLIISGEDLIALDAKVNFDDNALMLHPEIVELRDPSEEDPKELEAEKYDLNYIALDGNIACLVNGAGLAMATMDIIQKFGGRPANFLDVGGSATAEKITAAFEILLADPKVEAILVNIFGGIMKCDIIAEGIVEATKKTNLNVPLVVRLEGTNQKEGSAILANSGIEIIYAEGLSNAAKKAVAAAGGK